MATTTRQPRTASTHLEIAPSRSMSQPHGTRILLITLSVTALVMFSLVFWQAMTAAAVSIPGLA